MIPSMRELWKEAFGDSDEALDSFFNTAFSTQRCRVVANGNEVLGALYIFDCQYKNRKIAYIYAVATRKKARGQGICKKLTEDTHAYLKSNGYAGALLVPAEPSLFEFYKKLGYKTCSAIGELEAFASNDIIAVKQIEKSEFTDNRRLFLPENGIVQENENVDFLAEYASFYKGEDFLLTAYKKGNSLIGVELLGNAEKAPFILGALGCDKGIFRIPPQSAPNNTQTRPYAMYIAFDKSLQPPSYFGLAFD